MKSETRKIERTPEDKARIKAIRDKFQREKPSLKRLVESRDARPAMPLAAYMETQVLLHQLGRLQKHA